MATISDTTFHRAIKKFSQSLTNEQKRAFAASSEADVINEIQKIQDRYGSARKLRSLGRLSKFLEAMSQVEQLVQIFLNVSNVVAFIWGPIKFALLVAGTRLETLERLLDIYIEIGEVIPSLRQYDQLFKAAPSVLEVLERYYCDILEFHRHALEVFSSPGWKVFFDSAWRTFKTRLNPIVQSLKRHRELLSDEKLNATIIEIQAGREEIRSGRDLVLTALDKTTDQSSSRFNDLKQQIYETFTQLSEQIYGLQQSQQVTEAHLHNSHMDDLSVIVNKIDPPGFESDHLSAINSCHKGSGQWIFENTTFNAWTRSTTTPDSVLYINGLPGSGKTLIASTIIDKLKNEVRHCHTTCLFFYFKHSSENKRTMPDMLRAFLAQLMRQDRSLVPVFYEKLSAVNNSEARELHNLKTWALEFFKCQNTCTIILHGLDECERDNGKRSEASKILEWLLSSVIPDCEQEGARLRLLVLGQRDGDLDDTLSSYHSIRLDSASPHFQDIKSFAMMRASKIRERFSLGPEEERHIAHKVTEAANGMFLYAKVVMDNLLAQGSVEELEEELQTSFPMGLDEAYTRVTFRVLDCPTRPEKQREAAAKILRWLTCAVRPLRWNEIQCLFCINPELGVCNPRKRRVDGCKSLCGSFVDVDDMNSSHSIIFNSVPSNPFVNLVHETARRYLIQTQRVNLLEENARMAIWSSAYLTSLPFRDDIHEDEIYRTALSGYYGLEDYALVSIEKHLDESLKDLTNLSSIITDSLQHMIFRLIKGLGLGGRDQNDSEAMNIWKELLDGGKSETITQALEQFSVPTRAATEDIRLEELDNETRDIFISLNGPPLYRCRKLNCLKFSQGFKDKKSQQIHLAQHYNQFTCPSDGCPRRTIGFHSNLELEEHQETSHAALNKQLDLFPSSKKAKDIWSACARGDLLFVERFHRSGGDLQRAKTDRSYLSPFTIASRHGHLDICRYLALNGCSPFAATKLGGSKTFSAIAEAIQTRNKELYSFLLNSANPAMVESFKNSRSLADHIVIAMSSGDRTFLNPLLLMRSTRYEHLKDEDILDAALYCPTIYEPAAYELFFDVLKSLTKEGNKAGKTQLGGSYAWGLHTATLSNCPNTVAFLFRHMESSEIYKRDKDGNTPIYTPIRNNFSQTVSLFIELDLANDMAVCDSNQNRPLHVACKFRSLETVRLLLPYSFNHLNETNKEGMTPLQLAIYRRAREGNVKTSLKVVKALLDTGAIDLSKRSHEGETVFEMDTIPEIKALLRSVDPKMMTRNRIFPNALNASQNSLSASNDTA
ncbi:hypothetical protein F5Y14DRAFT_189934 [Nemania sp. NC0429]|nr:hypothetical protein F5Y14DRAFT_189934 [Nemania sp. NC0429]